MKIVLASASPRRAQLLNKMGLAFEVRPSDTIEEADGIRSSELLAMTLAAKKAEAVFRDGDIVLGADTIVVLDGKVLGKPTGRREAAKMLLSLSGRRHEVITGICIYTAQNIVSSYERTYVEFKEFTMDDIKQYVADGKCFDKAGGYGIQDDEIWALIKSVDGSVDNVIGLPTELFQKILGEHF